MTSWEQSAVSDCSRKSVTVRFETMGISHAWIFTLLEILIDCVAGKEVLEKYKRKKSKNHEVREGVWFKVRVKGQTRKTGQEAGHYRATKHEVEGRVCSDGISVHEPTVRKGERSMYSEVGDVLREEL